MSAIGPLTIPPPQVPIADGITGLINRIWWRYFNNILGGAGQGVGTVVTGTVVTFAGPDAPSGWLLCDGAAYSRQTFAGLFGQIGTTWGAGDGSTTFNVPNLTDRFIRASGAQGVGATGGAASVTLSTGQLPAHNHPVVDPGHVHTSLVAASNVTAGAAAGGVTAGNTASAVTGVTTSNTGSGSAVPTVPPYAVMIMMIKT